VGRYRAVLLDWRGTMVHIPRPEWFVEHALAAIGRYGGSATVAALVESLRLVVGLPEFVAAERWIDCSAEIHRSTSIGMFERSGMDVELADALYEVDFDPLSHPIYPDVQETLTAIRHLGVKIGVVSDIHFDVRPDLDAANVAELIDAYVLSFEHGFQEPDPRMFRIALEELGVEPHEALMVGDTARTDGGAVSVGVATLILPRPDELVPRGLDMILGLLA
jgi:HAD superfamily hydrolase (TIGR01509 family)